MFISFRYKAVSPAATQRLESSWNVMAHGDAREGKWRGENWRRKWVASTLHTTSEHGVSSITTADAHTPAASSRLNWRPCRFKWTRSFRRKTKSDFSTCAITFQTQSTLFQLFLTCKYFQRQEFLRENNNIISGLLPWKKSWETVGNKLSAWFPLDLILASLAEVSAVAEKKNSNVPTRIWTQINQPIIEYFVGYIPSFEVTLTICLNSE